MYLVHDCITFELSRLFFFRTFFSHVSRLKRKAGKWKQIVAEGVFSEKKSRGWLPKGVVAKLAGAWDDNKLISKRFTENTITSKEEGQRACLSGFNSTFISFNEFTGRVYGTKCQREDGNTLVKLIGCAWCRNQFCSHRRTCRHASLAPAVP